LMHMKCPYCAIENRPENHFCEECGAQLVTGEASDLVTRTGDLAAGLVPGTSLQHGRYVIARALGEGGMGSVLLAKDTRLADKLTVIKVLNAESADPEKLQEGVRNFKREAETLAHLDHPLIPDVTDHFEEGLHYYMVMDYVEGENLEHWLERTAQPMQEHDALRYALEVLDILEYLARQQPAIVHRDIKPANIIIGTKDRHAHLVDFGIARTNTAIDGTLRKTTALGTPGYAPPEQYQGFADPRSDLYALAATLHHLVTNRDPGEYAPFQFPAARTLNPALSPHLEQVLTRGLKTDATARYQTAREMRADLESLVAGTAIIGTTDGYRLSDTTVRQTLSPRSSGQAPADATTRDAFDSAPRSGGRTRQPQARPPDYSDPDYYQHLQHQDVQHPRPIFQQPAPFRQYVQQRQDHYPPQRGNTSRDQENQVMWYFILFVVAICIIALVAVLLFSSLHIY
jgi:serine/threonine protein kinase